MINFGVIVNMIYEFIFNFLNRDKFLVLVSVRCKIYLYGLKVVLYIKGLMKIRIWF